MTAAISDAAPSVPHSTPPSLLARLGAEFVGTFLLVFVIAGGGLYLGIAANSDALTLPLVAGGAFAIAIATFGHISGGNFNPAISLGQAISGELRWADLVPYWVAQILGAIAAAGITFMLIPGNLATAMGRADNAGLFSTLANGYGDHSPLGAGAASQQIAITPEIWQAFIAEIIATALLVGIFIIATRRLGRAAAAVNGLALAALMVVVFPFTNSGLNPARSTGIAFFSEPWALGHVWLFWLAPLLGAMIAGLLVTIIGGPTEDAHAGPQAGDESPAIAAPAANLAVSAANSAASPELDDDEFEVRDYT